VEHTPVGRVASLEQLHWFYTMLVISKQNLENQTKITGIEWYCLCCCCCYNL